MEQYIITELSAPILRDNDLTPYWKDKLRLPQLVNDALCHMTFVDEDVVLDIGCGKGFKTKYIILPLIKKYKHYLAIDKEQEIIKVAKSCCPAKNLEYYVDDIRDSSMLRNDWLGKITKVISIDCFNLLWENEELVFDNLLEIMAPEGEAVINFQRSTRFQVIYDALKKIPKWRKYLYMHKLHDLAYSEMQTRSTSGFRRMLLDTGFEVVCCEEREFGVAYKNDQILKDKLKKELDFMPEDGDEEEFMRDVFNSVLSHFGRNPEGWPISKVRSMFLHLKKPKL